MNKHLARVVPVAIAVLFLSGQQLYAIGNYTTVNSLNEGSTSEFEAALNKQKQVMYLIQDSDIYQQPTNTSSTIDREAKGSSLIIMGVEGEMCEVLTSTGLTGYVPVNRLTTSSTYIFNTEDRIMYIIGDAEIKQQPNDASTTIFTKVENEEVHVVGSNDNDYWKIEQDGGVYYVLASSLSDTPKVEEVTPVVYSEPIASSTWNGTPLTPSAGVIIGPSGKESYYNLDMSGCVSIMRSLGYDYEYWVREDGVKMYGDYVMVAADYSTRPRGTLLESSLGTAIVVDTGTFVYSNPTQIDIAVAW